LRRRYAYFGVAILALMAVTYPVIYSAYAGTITGTGQFMCPPIIPCDNSQPVSFTCTSFCIIDIQDSAFVPAVINVTQNAIVEWVNLDPNVHTSTAIYSNAWDSSFIPPGGHFILSFSNIPPGAYYYQCNVHPFMTGEINVLPANSTY
jgi:Cupredoxin-like domain